MRTPATRARRLGLAATVIGVCLVAAALAWEFNAWTFTHHTRAAQQRLLNQEAALSQRAAQTGNCQTSGATTPAGVLRASSIGLVAPVEQGLTDPVLADAVGHDPSSVWPGTRGTAVLAAHDVSYFLNIDQLPVGATLQYNTPCETYNFSVTGHQVVKAGSPVLNTPGPTLVLVTCWPTDALWFTPDRLIVTASETTVQHLVAQPAPRLSARVTAPYQAPIVSAPPPLVSQGLTLATNSIPMGTMTIGGTPDRTWIQSPGPLNVEGSAVEAFIGGVKAAEQGEGSWWRSLAPGVPLPMPLRGGVIRDYKSSLNVEVIARSTRARSVELSTTVDIAGGRRPGRYAITVDESLVGSRLRITQWTLHAI